MIKDIIIPALGESIFEATISKWYKKVGENINQDEIIVEIETDKVTQEIYATASGKIIEILFEEGTDVNIGEIVAKVDTNNKLPTNEVLLKEKKTEEKKLGIVNENKIIIPDLGESIKEVTIARWSKALGSFIKVDEVILELETDKATQEIYSKAEGYLSKIFYKEGEDVNIGETVGLISTSLNKENLDLREEKDSDKNNINIKKQIVESDIEKTNSMSLDPSSVKRSGLGNKITPNDLKEFMSNRILMPSARAIAEEENINLEKINATGHKGKILKDDIIRFKEEEAKIIKHSDSPLVERKVMSRLRQSIASRLKEAQNTAAMLTTFNEVDMTNVKSLRSKYKEQFLSKHNVKLGFMSFFIRASISVLKEIPTINAQIDGKDIIYNNKYDIGVAVGTDQGLVVPILRDADKKNMAELEKEIIVLGNQAKEGKLSLEQMKYGTFTISNGGVYGSMLSTPILNFPQSGILGLHNIVDRAVVIEGKIEVRPIMYLALTYDHRIIDGKEAVTFLVKLKEIIENPEILILNI